MPSHRENQRSTRNRNIRPPPPSHRNNHVRKSIQHPPQILVSSAGYQLKSSAMESEMGHHSSRQRSNYRARNAAPRSRNNSRQSKIYRDNSPVTAVTHDRSHHPWQHKTDDEEDIEWYYNYLNSGGEKMDSSRNRRSEKNTTRPKERREMKEESERQEGHRRRRSSRSRSRSVDRINSRKDQSLESEPQDFHRNHVTNNKRINGRKKEARGIDHAHAVAQDENHRDRKNRRRGESFDGYSTGDIGSEIEREKNHRKRLLQKESKKIDETKFHVKKNKKVDEIRDRDNNYKSHTRKHIEDFGDRYKIPVVSSMPQYNERATTRNAKDNKVLPPLKTEGILRKGADRRHVSDSSLVPSQTGLIRSNSMKGDQSLDAIQVKAPKVETQEIIAPRPHEYLAGDDPENLREGYENYLRSNGFEIVCETNSLYMLRSLSSISMEDTMLDASASSMSTGGGGILAPLKKADLGKKISKWMGVSKRKRPKDNKDKPRNLPDNDIKACDDLKLDDFGESAALGISRLLDGTSSEGSYKAMYVDKTSSSQGYVAVYEKPKVKGSSVITMPSTDESDPEDLPSEQIAKTFSRNNSSVTSKSINSLSRVSGSFKSTNWSTDNDHEDESLDSLFMEKDKSLLDFNNSGEYQKDKKAEEGGEIMTGGLKGILKKSRDVKENTTGILGCSSKELKGSVGVLRTNCKEIGEMSGNSKIITKENQGKVGILRGEGGCVRNEVGISRTKSKDHKMEISTGNGQKVEGMNDLLKKANKETNDNIGIVNGRGKELDSDIVISRTKSKENGKITEFIKRKEVGNPIKLSRTKSKDIGNPLKLSITKSKEVGNSIKLSRTKSKEVGNPIKLSRTKSKEVGNPIKFSRTKSQEVRNYTESATVTKEIKDMIGNSGEQNKEEILDNMKEAPYENKILDKEIKKMLCNKEDSSEIIYDNHKIVDKHNLANIESMEKQKAIEKILTTFSSSYDNSFDSIYQMHVEEGIGNSVGKSLDMNSDPILEIKHNFLVENRSLPDSNASSQHSTEEESTLDLEESDDGETISMTSTNVDDKESSGEVVVVGLGLHNNKESVECTLSSENNSLESLVKSFSSFCTGLKDDSFVIELNNLKTFDSKNISEEMNAGLQAIRLDIESIKRAPDQGSGWFGQMFDGKVKEEDIREKQLLMYQQLHQLEIAVADAHVKVLDISRTF